MERPWRLLRCPPAAGDWNMAVDELLLEEAAGGEPPTLRIYAWHRPTLSLGYFQKLDDIPAHEQQRYAVVRRMTGGGAILHDREVTYSLAMPGALFGGAALYDRVNGAILRGLTALGVAGAVRGPAAADGERAQRGPFLCFTRPSATDIIVHSRKLAGSAQRRRRGGVLQHGSILLEANAPGAVGVRELLPAARTVEFDDLAAAVIGGFAVEFAVTLEPRDLSPAERERAEVLRRSRYADIRWLRHGQREGEP